MSIHGKPQQNPGEQSEDRGHDANNPNLKRQDPPTQERDRRTNSRDMPERGGEDIKPQDTGEDLPATYEPDKRPSKRTTL